MSPQWNPVVCGDLKRYSLYCTKLAIPFIFEKDRFDIRAVWEKKVYGVCRAGLEEELDMLRVQAAMDRATVKELHLCLANEHQGKPFCLYFGIVLRELINKQLKIIIL